MERGTDLEARPEARNKTEARSYFTYLPEFGREARQFWTEHRQQGRQLSEQLALVGSFLRHHKVRAADRQIRSCEALLHEAQTVASDAVGAVLEADFYSVVAFRDYRTGSLHDAWNTLDRMTERITFAVGCGGFLIPFAERCYAVQLHRARIARGNGDWSTMWESVETGRSMAGNDRPLCVLPKGPVFLDDVCSFFRKVNPRNELEAQFCSLMSDARTLKRQFDTMALAAVQPPTTVVDWAPANN